MKPEIIATSLRQHQTVAMNYCPALNESEMGALASHDTGSMDISARIPGHSMLGVRLT